MADNKKGFSIRRLIFNDKYLIITSLLLAVLVWVITSLNIGTNESKTIKVDVPISLGDEVSEQLGMQYYTLQNTIELNVTVTGPKYAIGQVTGNDLNVKFDTSNVNRTGEQSIPILVTKSKNSIDFSVESVYPSSVDAFFDVNESKLFDLYLKYDEDAVADGYTFGEPVLSEDKIVVSGPKTYVDKIDRAIVDVTFSSGEKLTEPYSAESQISVEGTGVEASYLTYAARNKEDKPISTVTVSLPVLKVMSLPVSVDINDKPSGFDSSKMRIYYSTSKLQAGVLDSSSIKSATIGSISFSDLKTGINKFTFDVTDLEGITVIDEDVKTVDVTVSVDRDFTSKTVTINPSDIKITGVAKDKTATLSNVSSRRITVYVPDADKDAKITLGVKCDMGNESESGTYPLTFTVKGSTSAWVYGDYTADVAIK